MKVHIYVPEKDGFNPTLVRLRLGSGAQLFPRPKICFNPTLVRLRPRASDDREVGSNPSFNPTLVRLRRPQDVLDLRQKIVSIPRWFD